ncbi:tetratricopeptide repeat protein [Duganella sp. CT11-25]|uniref:tetratricopeptide repeat protein n=1 Tax=unclassified Duganella TaxID=2636909 RepID=UPI0039AFEA55
MGLVGKQHHDLVEWFSGGWWAQGEAPVAMLQGFPGSGKTEIADVVEQRCRSAMAGVKVLRCDFPQSSGTVIDDLILLIAAELARKGDDRLARHPTESTLLALLGEPLLIVIDEFQASFDEQLTQPPAALTKWIAEISGRKELRARILFLTSRQLNNQRWNERCDKHSLAGLSPEDGLTFLAAQLDSSGMAESDLPQERRLDVVKWLGGFPRAIRLLVGALHHNPLNELIGALPEAWEAREQTVSARLLRSIETEMVARARKGLPPEIDRFFERLAVFRRPVDSAAIAAVSEGMLAYPDWQAELQLRFLLELRQHHYSLHPALRETVLMPLSKELRQRHHALAGKHYGRHFLGKKIEGVPVKLGAAFIEARYHYTQSGNKDELGKIAHAFEGYVRDRMGWTTPVPALAEECNEGIALLSALLVSGGAMSMHYYLARLLQRRNQPGDIKRALDHAKAGTGPQSPHEAWLLRAQLIEQCNGKLGALNDMAAHGLKILPPERNLFALYQRGSELSRELGKNDKAIALLREGIARIGQEYSLYVLYIRAAELLVAEGKADEALLLLEDGIGRIGPHSNIHILYLDAADLLDHCGKTSEAITLLIKGMALIGSHPSNYSVVEKALRLALGMLDLSALHEIQLITEKLHDFEFHAALAEVYRLLLLKQETTRTVDAVVALQARISRSKKIPAYQVAYCCLSVGAASKAQAILDQFFADTAPLHAASASWLTCFIQLELHNQARADELLSLHLGRPLMENESADRARLLAIWDQPSSKSGRGPAADFPVLPPAMSGLAQTVHRTRWQSPVLTEVNSAAMPAPPSPPSDWNAENVIISLRPKNWNGLYVLGCFDHRITVFAQQARALSLVRALFEVGDLKAGQTVGIVGAGAAGVTAAVAAARLGCAVSLYDEHDAPFAMQASAQHRYLHPHIYDWPARGSDRSNAGLPLMNWDAGYADDVVTHLRAEFDRHQDGMGHSLTFRPCSVITHIKKGSGAKRIQLLGNEATINQSFDLVLLASGFGVERSPMPHVEMSSYWGGDGISGPFPSPRRILVSGAGDGGLVDVARASIRSSLGDNHFRHDQAVQELTTDPAFRVLANAMAEVDARARQARVLGGQPENLYQGYSELFIEGSLLERMRKLKRSDTDVTFNYMDESIFGLGSALLNRLLVLLLMKAEVVQGKFGTISAVTPSQSNPARKQVVFNGDIAGAADFDIVVLRHGPPKAEFERRFPALADDCVELRGKVAELALTQKLSPETASWYAEALSR